MAHETLLLNGKVRSLTHLEIEIVFRAMIRAIETECMHDLDAVADEWKRGLASIDVGLVDIELEPHFCGRGGAARLAALIDQGQSMIRTDVAEVPIEDLNGQLGTRIDGTNATIDRRVIDEGFEKLTSLVQDVAA